jgi:uracil-DNA glycosylase
LRLSHHRGMNGFYSFVEGLASIQAPPFTFNPYNGCGTSEVIRRQNLICYLKRMSERRPRLMLIGEAPGYRGCRVTGIPFTSEAILVADQSPFDLFGAKSGFRASGSLPSRKREATATILWHTLEKLDVLPLLWNAFPFHPHRPDEPSSNRPPKPDELKVGERITKDLLALFDIGQVIAVGNKATVALAGWGIPAAHVRHPSRGGKLRFEQELAQLVRN